jgi:G3E family GTPase
VLVNDFGAVDIDARLIATSGATTIALTNGCICCSIGDDLTRALIRVVDARPAPDWILIEASGVSDPWKIAQVGLVDPVLALDGVVVLADAQSVRAHAEDVLLADTVRRQLVAADLLVLNKADLVSSQTLRATRQWIGGEAPDAWIYETCDGDVPLELLCSLAAKPGASGSRPRRTNRPAAIPGRFHPPDHAHAFSAWSFETRSVFSAPALRALLSDMPRGIVRAKGILRVDEAPGDATVLQFAGRSRMLRRYGPWSAGPSRIVAIGASSEVDFAVLRERVEHALIPDDASLVQANSANWR